MGPRVGFEPTTFLRIAQLLYHLSYLGVSGDRLHCAGAPTKTPSLSGGRSKNCTRSGEPEQNPAPLRRIYGLLGRHAEVAVISIYFRLRVQ